MSQFSSVIQEVRKCTICEKHLPHGVRPVLQVHPKARILISGQAPGRKVHETGVPFDDPSGERLRDWMGIERDTFYNPEKICIVPMGFCFPGTGKSGDLPPRKECAPAWRAPILSFLKKIELNLVIGQYAQAYHFPQEKSSLTERVKNWSTYWPNEIPLPHPSPRNNIWFRRNPWFEEEVIPALKNRIAGLLSS